MELIKYLNNYFFTKQELLDITKITEQDLLKYQNDGVMPKCSYKLSLNIKSDSFFGLHHDEKEIEYYAKGYSSWLAIIQSLNSTEAIYSVFANRYKIAKLCSQIIQTLCVAHKIKQLEGVNVYDYLSRQVCN